jgi:hypothetical protein
LIGEILGLGGDAIPVSPQPLGGLASGAPGAPRGHAPSHARLAAAETVEQGKVSAGVEKTDRLMLSVDFDQQCAEVAQHADTRRLIVDEGARTAIGADHPAQHQVFVPRVSEAAVVEVAPYGVIGARREHRRGGSLRGSVANQRRLRANTSGEA